MLLQDLEWCLLVFWLIHGLACHRARFAELQMWVGYCALSSST